MITDKGIVKKINQDSMTVKVVDTQIGKIVMAVICDGMGGLSRGEVASALVIKEFSNWFYYTLPVLLQHGLDNLVIKQGWNQVIANANKEIQRYGSRNNIKLGTTVSGLLLTDKNYYIIHVGDSRIYTILNEVSQVTKDHSFTNHILLQCVGAAERIIPDFLIGKAMKNMMYLLCTDGFRHKISNKEIYMNCNFTACEDSDVMKRQLHELITLDKLRMESDNISAILIKVY